MFPAFIRQVKTKLRLVKIIFHKIVFVEQLTTIIITLKIFDEILVNAADNKQRDKKMDTIKIDIKPEEGMIRVSSFYLALGAREMGCN